MNPSPTRHFSLNTRLILTVSTLVVSCVALVSAVNFLSLRQSTLEAVSASTHNLAEARAESIAQWVNGKSAVVHAMLPATQTEDPSAALTQAVQSGGFDTTYIGYQDKRAIFSSPQNLPEGWDPTARPWYLQAAGANGMVLTEPYVDAGSKKLVMTFAQAVKDGGQTRAVVAGDVFMDVVASAVTSIHPTPASDAFILSRDGKVLGAAFSDLTGRNIGSALSLFVCGDELVTAIIRARLEGAGQVALDSLGSATFYAARMTGEKPCG